MKRVTIIVLDSVGCGASPDAHLYGDEGSNTLSHIAAAVPEMKLPNLAALGLGLIQGVTGIGQACQPIGNYGRMQPQSAGKDTTTGHWELAGLVLDIPFPVYPDGFPGKIVAQLEKAFGRKIIGNKPASGTEIIASLGDEHVRTGCPIVYTSADSVLQIAAHESIIPLEQLYAYCQAARKIMQGPHAVGRIIARPFTGQSGAYQRTVNRHDYSLEPFAPTVLDRAKASGYVVAGIGKINDIYAGRGLTRTVKSVGNLDGIKKTIEWLKEPFDGILMVNLVDFDMLYGHRNDPEGYAAALMEFDHYLPAIMSCLSAGELLLLTADHGCDPTWTGTDHTREYVPILAYRPELAKGLDLGTRVGFSDLAATVSDYLDLPDNPGGISFWPQLR
ncbi:MAG: phosphopentomutase [Bacillota bacterium]|nr:phosphopentomutase [Bacillota bacterium]